VRLLLRGEHGERIQPSKVSLLFDWWGGSDVVDVPSPGGVTAIDMDSAWVAAKWPIIWSQMEGARLLIKADGCTPSLSDTFAWLDQKQNGVEPWSRDHHRVQRADHCRSSGTQRDSPSMRRR
jgi:hypothetical protein